MCLQSLPSSQKYIFSFPHCLCLPNEKIIEIKRYSHVGFSKNNIIYVTVSLDAHAVANVERMAVQEIWAVTTLTTDVFHCIALAHGVYTVSMLQSHYFKWINCSCQFPVLQFNMYVRLHVAPWYPIVIHSPATFSYDWQKAISSSCWTWSPKT